MYHKLSTYIKYVILKYVFEEEYLLTTTARGTFLYIFLSPLIVLVLGKIDYSFKPCFLDMPCTYTEDNFMF